MLVYQRVAIYCYGVQPDTLRPFKGRNWTGRTLIWVVCETPQQKHPHWTLLVVMLCGAPS